MVFDTILLLETCGTALKKAVVPKQQFKRNYVTPGLASK